MGDYELRCPNCGQALSGGGGYGGVQVTCPSCGKQMATRVVPTGPTGAASGAPGFGPGPEPGPCRSEKTCGLAIASLICSIGSFIIIPFGFIPGVICGHLARRKIARTPGLAGVGLATAGLIIGYTAVAGYVLVMLIYFYFAPPITRVDATRLGSVNLGSINGKRITEKQFADARREVYLRQYFMTGNWPDDESAKQRWEIERDTYQWLLLIQKQTQAGIHVSSGAAAQAGKAMVSQLQRSGIASPEAFVRRVLQPRGLDMGDMERFVTHHLGVQELITKVSGSGQAVTPQEVRKLYEHEYQELATAAVVFSASNYLTGVVIPPDALTQFYSERMATYRLPERVQVSYVGFGLADLTAQADDELARTNNLDLQNSRRKAGELAFSLLDAVDPMRVDSLEKVAREKGLTVRVTEPFNLQDGPKELAVGQDFAQKAFALTLEDPFAGPIVGRKAVYVIALKKRIPSEVPPLDQIGAQVLKDYQASEGLNLARKAGMEFYRTLTNGLAQGKTPASICAEAKLQLVDLPPFSLGTQQLPEVGGLLPLGRLKQVAFAAPVGGVSPFQMTSEGGLIIFVRSKVPLDEAQVNAKLPVFANRVRQDRQKEVFDDWLRREAEKGLRDTPLARQQPPQNETKPLRTGGGLD